MSIEVLDPTYGAGGNAFALAGRLASLEGKTFGIVSNGKRGTRPFFTALERCLTDDFGAARVVHHVKANYSAPAEPAIVADIANWDAAFVGIGD